jgi:hypothetical protein
VTVAQQFLETNKKNHWTGPEWLLHSSSLRPTRRITGPEWLLHSSSLRPTRIITGPEWLLYSSSLRQQEESLDLSDCYT